MDKPEKSSGYLKLISVALLVIALFVIARYFNIGELLRSSLAWISSLGIWGPIAFIFTYNLATVLFIPGVILTLGAGAVFGIIWGSIYTFIGATLGSISAFLVGRYLARNWVSQQIENNPKFKAIDLSVAKEGFKIVLLARLSPVFPFNFLNYAFGLTQVSLKDFFLASIGMIPGTIAYVYLGSLAGSIAAIRTVNQPTDPQTETVRWIIRIIGFIATIVVTVYVTRIAKKALETEISS